MRDNQNAILDKIQVLLAEKRTSLAIFRTGLALFTVPLSVFTILIAASEFYDIWNIFPLFAFLVSLCIFLVITGSYFIARSLRTIHRIDSRIKELKNNLTSGNS